MGTSNFHYKNASKVFAICMPFEDDETGEYVHPESWEYEEAISSIRESMARSEGNFQSSETGYDNQELRSYPSTVIGEFSNGIQCNGKEIDICLTAVAHSGYYEGACLDWNIQVTVDGCEFDMEDDSESDWLDIIASMESSDDDSNEDTMELSIFKNYAPKWIQETRDAMVTEIERIYAECSGVQLEVVGRFSNGETIYKQVNN